MTEPTELLPCPFCGASAVAGISRSESLWSHDIVDWTRVHCTNDDCNAQTEPTCDGYEPSAIEVWNRRTPQPTQAQAGAVPLTKEMQRQMKERCDSYEMRGVFADGWLSAEAAHGIKGGQHG